MHYSSLRRDKLEWNFELLKTLFLKLTYLWCCRFIEHDHFSNLCPLPEYLVSAIEFRDLIVSN